MDGAAYRNSSPGTNRFSAPTTIFLPLYVIPYESSVQNGHSAYPRKYIGAHGLASNSISLSIKSSSDSPVGMVCSLSSQPTETSLSALALPKYGQGERSG